MSSCIHIIYKGSMENETSSCTNLHERSDTTCKEELFTWWSFRT